MCAINTLIAATSFQHQQLFEHSTQFAYLQMNHLRISQQTISNGWSSEEPLMDGLLHFQN